VPLGQLCQMFRRSPGQETSSGPSTARGAAADDQPATTRIRLLGARGQVERTYARSSTEWSPTSRFMLASAK
jgi:hypothetical protein